MGPSIATASPIPSNERLVISVVFLPRFLGPCRMRVRPLALAHTRASCVYGYYTHPRTPGDQRAGLALARARRLSSPRRARLRPRSFLDDHPTRLTARYIVVVLTHMLRVLHHSSQCSLSVESGWASSPSDSPVSSAAPLCEGGPGMGLGFTPPASRRSLRYRLIVDSDTLKARLNSVLGIPW